MTHSARKQRVDASEDLHGPSRLRGALAPPPRGRARARARARPRARGHAARAPARAAAPSAPRHYRISVPNNEKVIPSIKITKA